MTFYDFRPAAINLPGLQTGQADLKALPFPDDSISSLSCLHVVEHVGLGRYGDPLDPDGDLKAMKELQRVLAPGGQLLFAVPMGKPTIFYNAHRIFGFEQITRALDSLRLVEFAFIPDDPGLGDLNRNVYLPSKYENIAGCGCFLFNKKVAA
jgi:SAM-dependent methyltransferase